MTRGQRRVHLRVWAVLAVALPVSVAVIVAMAANKVTETAPVQLAPPATQPATQGPGG